VYLVLDDFGRFGRAWRPGAIEIGAELHQPLLLLLAQRRRPPRDDGSDLAFNCVYGLQRLVPAALQLAGHEAIGVRPKSHRCRRGGCDIVALKVEDVAPHGYAVERATVRQKKTGLPVRFEVTEQTRKAVDDYIRAADMKPGEFLFAAPRRPGHGLSTRQYARLVEHPPCRLVHELRRGLRFAMAVARCHISNDGLSAIIDVYMLDGGGGEGPRPGLNRPATDARGGSHAGQPSCLARSASPHCRRLVS